MPTAGNVRLDLMDLRNWDPRQFGESVGYLPQDVQLFPATIKANIARMREDATDEAIFDAAEIADVHEMISEFSQGYETLIGIDGSPLSGGQKQRIGLARAFFGDPKARRARRAELQSRRRPASARWRARCMRAKETRHHRRRDHPARRRCCKQRRQDHGHEGRRGPGDRQARRDPADDLRQDRQGRRSRRRSGPARRLSEGACDASARGSGLVREHFPVEPANGQAGRGSARRLPAGVRRLGRHGADVRRHRDRWDISSPPARTRSSSIPTAA